MQASTPSFTGALWAPLLAAPELIARGTARGLSPVAARLLALRFPDRVDEGAAEPVIEHLHDPATMLHMDAAVDRLRRSVRDRERIRVVTDYDVDGTTSSLILQAALKIAAGTSEGANVTYHIPHRFVEGYGFSVAAAEAAARDGVALIVTADIGVRDHAAVAKAREHGIDVLVCDHHLPHGAQVPEDALVLCPPQEGDAYANPALAACGISLKVAQAMLATHPKRDEVVRSLLKLAAIGTVADLVPLTTRENRAIVALGLRELNTGRHSLGLAALLKAAGLGKEPIRENDLGYRVGPRINAAGRVADAKLVVELLTCRDAARATELAGEIERLNSQRRDLQGKLSEDALRRAATMQDPFVIIAGREEDGYHRGLVGIVASRVKDEVHRPTAIVSIQGDRAVGSIRSVPGVHAVHALDSARDLLEKYGGHPVAAGFTVPTHNLEALRERLCQFVVAALGGGAPAHVREVDAFIDVGDLGEPLLAELERLGPFGMGNPRPRLVVRRVEPRNLEVRADKGLVKFAIPRAGGGWIEAVWWDHTDLGGRLAGGPVDLLGELQEHRWNGTRRLQFLLHDARASG